MRDIRPFCISSGSACSRTGQRVVGFPISECWLDIGQPADCQQACEDIIKGQLGTRADG
jgi:NDP-sugar pyrophosphorylase family protein